MSNFKKIIKTLFITSLSFVSAIGLVSISNNQDSFSQTEKKEATHTSNYSSYTYSGSYYNGVDLANLTNGINGSLRSTLTNLIYPKGWHTYNTDNTGTLSYVLQKADEDPNNSSNMIYFYTRNSVKKVISNGGNNWNREHVWPQSLSNDHWGTDPGAGSDIFHIRPVYASVNSSRSNQKFAEITGTQKTYNSMTYGYSDGTYFKPLAANKGDVARIIMYLYVAYYTEMGSDRPDITAVFKDYDTLMEWHTNDKPDILEGNRNNYVQSYTNQKNRNPFVDHPEYAWHIFGSKCSSSVLAAAKAAYPDETTSSGDSGSSSGGSTNSSLGALLGDKQATYTINSTTSATATGSVPSGSTHSYSSTYTRSYQLTAGNSMSLTLKGYTGTIIKGLTLSMKSNTSAGAGSLLVTAGTMKLKDMSAYDFNDDHWYGAYTTSYVDVGIGMTVVNHTMTDTEDLVITITATTNSIYCNAITVGYNLASTLSSISLSGMTTTYNVGDKFSFDGVCTATYVTGETKTVTPTSVSAPDMSTPGTKTVKVSYEEDGKTCSKSYTITVNSTTIDEPEVTGEYYQKVTSTPSSWDGTYLIVNEEKSVIFNGALTTLDASANNFSVTISNNMIASTTATDNAAFTISSNQYIRSKSGYYIGQTSDANGLLSSTSTAYTNTISLTESGDVDIVSSGGTHLRYNSSSNNLRFRYYKSTTYTSQKAIQLYKLVDGASALDDAQAWANSFLSSITCNGGITKPSVTNWNNQASSYSNLDVAVKNIFEVATYNLSGDVVTPTNGTDSTIAKAVARYDFIIIKYGNASYQEFMTNRKLNLNYNLSLINENTHAAVLLIPLTLLCVLGVCLYHKKKKYKNY